MRVDEGQNYWRARKALTELQNAIGSIEGRLSHPPSADRFPDSDLGMVALAETAYTACRAAHDLYASLGAEALDRGVSPALLNWADPRTSEEQ